MKLISAKLNSKIKAKVEHIYFESKTVNNVTIYEVDLLPEDVPPFFRSGMNATIDFVVNSKENVLLLPYEAVFKEKDGTYVWIKQANAKEHLERAVKLGVTEDKNVEILSGIDSNDTVIVKTKKYVLPKNNMGSNPFMPARSRKR